MSDTTEQDFTQYILGGELNAEEETQEEEKEEAAPQDNETDEAPGEAEVSEETEDEIEEQGEAEEHDAQSQPDLYTVKVNGVEKQVTLDELKRDYSGQSYVQQRMQEAAAKVKEAEQLQQQAMTMLQQVVTHGVLPMPKVPDPAIADTDPVRYIKEQARYQKEVAAYQAQQSQIAQIHQRNAQAAEQQRHAELIENAERLKADIPEFADPQKAEAIKADLIKAGREYGYTDSDLLSVTDARAIKVLRDAMQWRKLQSQKAQPDKPGAPKVVKPAAKRSEPPQLAEKKIIEKAKRSGDWTAYLMQPTK